MSSDSSFKPPFKAEGQPTPVVRPGDTVVRPAGPWTPAVHALLRHLERAGFAGSPRVVADGYDDQGREVVTYIEGTFVHPHAWTDDGVWQVGRLLRDLHDATAGFQTPPDAHDDDIAERQALPTASARAAQLRYFLDGYRLPAVERDGLVTRMIEYAIRDCAAAAITSQVTPGSTDPAPLWALAWPAACSQDKTCRAGVSQPRRPSMAAAD